MDINTVGPHTFRPLSRWRPRTCRACYLARGWHPVPGWTEARPVGDTRRRTVAANVYISEPDGPPVTIAEAMTWYDRPSTSTTD